MVSSHGWEEGISIDIGSGDKGLVYFYSLQRISGLTLTPVYDFIWKRYLTYLVFDRHLLIKLPLLLFLWAENKVRQLVTIMSKVKECRL